jgi:hypothetical protein
MGLERRGNHTYYYTKERSGRRVVSRYVGSGYLAELAASLDVMKREEQEWKRLEEAAELERFISADADVATVGRQVDVLLTACLLANGYYQHKGQWRKRRG